MSCFISEELHVSDYIVHMDGNIWYSGYNFENYQKQTNQVNKYRVTLKGVIIFSICPFSLPYILSICYSVAIGL